MRCPTLKELPLPPSNKTGWPWTEDSPQLPDAMPDGSPWPKISIITPSFNQCQFIEETIRSVLLQGYPDLEYIIIDGGSTDDSVEIISKYEKWLKYWASEPDNGQGHAINKGFSRVTGELISWLNSDDFYTRDALLHISRVFQENRGCAAVVGECRRVTPDGHLLNIIRPNKLTRDDIVYWGFDGGNIFYQPATFMAVWAVKAAGNIREDLYICIDYEYWLRLMKEGIFVPCPHVVAEAIIHPQAKTQAYRSKMLSERILVMIEQGYMDRARLMIDDFCYHQQCFNNKLEKIKRYIPYWLIKLIKYLFNITN